MTVKFNKFHVAANGVKARVWYSLDNRPDAPCVTLYARDYTRELGEIFSSEYQNDTEIMTDYFDKGRVVLYPNHPLYQAARTRGEANRAKR